MFRVLRRFSSSDRPAIATIVLPFQKFASLEASGGVVLLACTVAALIWANSGFGHTYESLWETHLAIGIPSFQIDKDLHFWINDALMAAFFFVVGLEIKRAIIAGELASPRRAALPLVAAVGGMAIPAVLYLLLNLEGAGAQGWGIPMATDIAFSLGVLALLGSRAPLSLKLFLTALAIVDDIGAVIVIAIFYTESISVLHLGIAGALLIFLTLANIAGVRSPTPYALVAVVVWVAFLESGIHASIAGVVMAMVIPLRVRINSAEFLERGTSYLEKFGQAGEFGRWGPDNLEQRSALEELEEAAKQVDSPLRRLEHSLHPWVTYGIMPIFALANAGVVLDGGVLNTLAEPVTLGVILGLVIGKPLGVILLSWIALRSGLAAMPGDVSWKQLTGVAFLAGIGFTMSIFITGLAFTDSELISEAKLGVLLASMAAGIIGYLILWSAAPVVEGGPVGDGGEN